MELTLWWLVSAVPRLPCSSAQSQTQYRSQNGLSRPSEWSRAATCWIGVDPENQLGRIAREYVHHAKGQEGDAQQHRDGGDKPPPRHPQGWRAGHPAPEVISGAAILLELDLLRQRHGVRVLLS